MARSIRRLLSLLIVGSIVGSIASLLYALQVKRRTVSTREPEGDEIALAAVFDTLAFTSTARSFRGGSVLCYYGGGILDLRSATMDPAGARLHLTAAFGGGQLLVPETWRVESHVRGVFGGVGPSRPGGDLPPGAPTLRLEGFAIFGGWGIGTDAPEDTTRWMEKMRARRGQS